MSEMLGFVGQNQQFVVKKKQVEMCKSGYKQLISYLLQRGF